MLGTTSPKEKIRTASAVHLDSFKRIIKGLTTTNKQIAIEKQFAAKRIEDLKVDIKDYDEIEKENQNVVDGLESLLGINKVKTK